MKRKVKKFGRGGDILTGIGAALVGKHLYDKYVGGKDDTKKNLDTIEEPSYDKNKLISSEVDKAQKGAKRPEKTEDDKNSEIFKKHASYFGGNVGNKPGGGGNVGTRTNTESPNSAASRDSNQLKSNILDERPPQYRVQTTPYTGPAAQGVNEKDLDRLQRRDVPSGRKKSAPAKKSSADDVIGAGQKYANIGRSSTSQFLKDRGAETLPAKPDKTPKAEPVKKEVYRDLSGKLQYKTKDADVPNLGKAVGETVSEGAKKLAGSYKSPAERQAEREKDKEGKRTYRDFSGKIQTYAKGGSVSSASKRADGIAQRGKTRGKVY